RNRGLRSLLALEPAQRPTIPGCFRSSELLPALLRPERRSLAQPARDSLPQLRGSHGKVSRRGSDRRPPAADSESRAWVAGTYSGLARTCFVAPQTSCVTISSLCA